MSERFQQWVCTPPHPPLRACHKHSQRQAACVELMDAALCDDVQYINNYSVTRCSTSRAAALERLALEVALAASATLDTGISPHAEPRRHWTPGSHHMQSRGDTGHRGLTTCTAVVTLSTGISPHAEPRRHWAPGSHRMHNRGDTGHRDLTACRTAATLGTGISPHAEPESVQCSAYTYKVRIVRRVYPVGVCTGLHSFYQNHAWHQWAPCRLLVVSRVSYSTVHGPNLRFRFKLGI